MPFRVKHRCHKTKPARWHSPVFPAAREAEAGGSLGLLGFNPSVRKSVKRDLAWPGDKWGVGELGRTNQKVREGDTEPE
jgi:hypothetical protein